MYPAGNGVRDLTPGKAAHLRGNALAFALH